MITSLSNQRIKDVRKLHGKQQRIRTGSFLVEGRRLIGDALRSGATLEEVYYCPQLFSGKADAEALVDELTAYGVECTDVSEQVFASISDTVTPQGIVAVAKVPVLPVPEPLSMVLILDGVSDPGNAGTLMRSAEASGVDLVLFGPLSVDAFNEKVVRSAMGAHFRLALRQCAEWSEVWRIVGKGLQGYVAEIDADLSYFCVDWRIPSALIIGSEAFGASAESRQHARSVSIPMHGPVESLNAAMAGTIMLFEAARQRSG